MASRTFPEVPQTARLEAKGVPRDQPVISEFTLVHPGPCPMAGLGERGWWDQQAFLILVLHIVRVWLDAVERENPKISLRFIIVICVLQIRTEYTQVRCTEYNNSVEYSAKRRGNRQDIDRIAATGHLGRGPELHRTLVVITS